MNTPGYPTTVSISPTSFIVTEVSEGNGFCFRSTNTMTDLLITSTALLDAINNYLPVELMIEVTANLAPEMEQVARAIKLTEECQSAVESVSADLGE